MTRFVRWNPFPKRIETFQKAEGRPTFNEEELLLMKTVAGQVAIAMERIRLIEALRKSRDELEMRVQERTEELLAKIEDWGSKMKSV